MKASNILILALAVTLFVACSKKKDGGGNVNQNQNRYGYTPNDINGNRGYQPGMPGYQLPQNGCNGSTQMFSNLPQYCAWLATEGERVCNPNIVRQLFLQRCQAIPTQNNYCQTQIRTGCYYSSGGCSFGGSTRIRSSSYSYNRSRRNYNDDGAPSHTVTPAPIVTPAPTHPVQPTPVTPSPVQPDPIVIHPPHNDDAIDCKATPGKDCKKLNPKKEKLTCKLQGDADIAANYQYTYEEYVSNVEADCNSGRTEEVVTDGGNNDVSSNVVAVDTSNEIIDARPVQAQTVERTETTAQAAVAVEAVTPVQAKVEATQECLNIAKLNSYISNIDNNLSSSSEYFRVDLLQDNHSKEFIAAFNSFLKPTLDKYSLSVSFRGKNGQNGRTSALTAIGANINQNDKAISLWGNLGAIRGCDSRHVSLYFSKADDNTRLLTGTYTWNGFGWKGEGSDADFELIETMTGQFKHGNELGKYILGRYIGLGKNLSESEIQAKILADMKRKGLSAK